MTEEARMKTITCGDSCGASLTYNELEPTAEQATELAKWVYLEIRRAWRCGACHAALQEVNHPSIKELS